MLIKATSRTFAEVGEDNRYRFYNRRPDGKKLEDCVCRAISTATGLNYEAVEKLLEWTADSYNCDKLCVCCYHNLLDGVFNYERRTCTHGETVEDLAKAFVNHILIIRVDAHLTCSINGIIPDIWDCSKEKVDCFWIVH